MVLIALLISTAGALLFGLIAAGVADGPLVRIVFSALASTVTAPIEALVAGVLYYSPLALRASSPAAEPPPIDLPPPAIW